MKALNNKKFITLAAALSLMSFGAYHKQEAPTQEQTSAQRTPQMELLGKIIPGTAPKKRKRRFNDRPCNEI